ncbi:MAG: hypothetical protein ACTTH5_02160 [Wolinella sp.]
MVSALNFRGDSRNSLRFLRFAPIYLDLLCDEGLARGFLPYFKRFSR